MSSEAFACACKAEFCNIIKVGQDNCLDKTNC